MIGFEHNGTKYWYDKNLQGDITAIRNASGTLVAQYEYDAWGKHISITDGSGNDVSNNETHIANINPFRYRGYYFDVETGWYYLNARYYAPNVGRFISPDAILGANGGLQGYNLFAYCNNNPVMYIDPNGMCMRGVYNDFPFICHDYSENGVCVYCGKRWTNDYIRALFDEEGLPAYVDPVLRSRYLALNSCAVQRQEAIAKIKRRAATEPIKKVYEEEMAAVLCFVAGTEIKTEQGDKPIEEIRIGDYVWAYSPETDEAMLKRVTNTFVNKTDRLMRIIVNGEEIMATPEHPFYIPYCTDSRSADWGLGSGWIKAKDLRAGDVLYLLDGSTAVIEYIELVLLTCPVSVFNFEVEDFHSYFVSSYGVLAHNKCLNESQQAIKNWAREYERTGISESDAKILWGWAVEYNVPGHAPGYDSYKWGYHLKLFNHHINIIS